MAIEYGAVHCVGRSTIMPLLSVWVWVWVCATGADRLARSLFCRVASPFSELCIGSFLASIQTQ